MKYLIDPNYVTHAPYSLVPDTLAYLTGLEPFRNINLISNLNKKAFSKFDGIDLNLTLAGLFKGEENKPRWNKIKKIKKKGWKIYTFHGGHENLTPQFRYMETNLAEDTKTIRSKIRAQLEIAHYLSRSNNTIIVYHPGFVKQKGNNYNATLKNLEFAVKEAENKNIIIAIENMPQEKEGYHIGTDYRELKNILKEIKSPNLRICFDWGHANTYARTFAKENKKSEDYVKNFGYQKEMIENLNKKIVYAHIHYNKSHLTMTANDYHLPLTKIPAQEIETYSKTIKDLMQKTSIKKHDSILLELMPKKAFGFYEFWPTGSIRKEQYKSLDLLKEMVEK